MRLFVGARRYPDFSKEQVESIKISYPVQTSSNKKLSYNKFKVVLVANNIKGVNTCDKNKVSTDKCWCSGSNNLSPTICNPHTTELNSTSSESWVRYNFSPLEYFTVDALNYIEIEVDNNQTAPSKDYVIELLGKKGRVLLRKILDTDLSNTSTIRCNVQKTISPYFSCTTKITS